MASVAPLLRAASQSHQPPRTVRWPSVGCLLVTCAWVTGWPKTAFGLLEGPDDKRHVPAHVRDETTGQHTPDQQATGREQAGNLYWRRA